MITLAFVIGGVLAAAATVLLVVQRPLVTPIFGFQVAIPALVGVVVGGLDRLVTGDARRVRARLRDRGARRRAPRTARASSSTSVVFVLVIVVLLLRPDGLFSRRRAAAERV